MSHLDAEAIEDWASPLARVSQASRVACAVLGSGLVQLFGLPIVHAVARGTVPYDLHGLTWATAPGRLPQMVAIMLCGLGVVALVAAAAPGRWAPLVAAVLFTGLIAWSVVQIEPVSSGLLAVRVVVVIGGSVILTALIAAGTLGTRPSPRP